MELQSSNEEVKVKKNPKRGIVILLIVFFAMGGYFLWNAITAVPNMRVVEAGHHTVAISRWDSLGMGN